MAGNAIDLPKNTIADFCQLWLEAEFARVGSVLRDDLHNDLRPDSDIDAMVQFHPEAHPTISNLDQMEAEQEAIFHREVDLISRDGIEQSLITICVVAKFCPPPR